MPKVVSGYMVSLCPEVRKSTKSIDILIIFMEDNILKKSSEYYRLNTFSKKTVPSSFCLEFYSVFHSLFVSINGQGEERQFLKRK